MKKHLGLAVIVLFAMTALSPAIRAQDPPPPPPDQSGQQQTAPPDQNAQADDADQNPQTQPTVGRVSFIHGNVSIQRGDSGDWIAATLNTPLEAGDRVSTGDDSRAEVQLDYANIIRLAPNSTVKITNLTKSQIQVQVGEGLASYDVLQNSQADSEIDTPNSAIHPLRQGQYRVEIVNDSQSQITVRNGEAEVSEPQGSTRIDSGQLITIQGTDNPQYQTDNAAGPDDFDQWNQSRDQTITGAQSWGHTDRYYTGSQDLDTYGHWENVPDYGQVWVPDQDSGWAPYRDGTWEWEPYYGWTWVSYEPWGWAPYHYGRWFVYGGNWAWWPGPVGVYGGWGYYPVYSPAYVSFFGWGGGVGFGFGFGSIGWLPCGPGDFFHPWWGFGVGRVDFVDFDHFHDRDDWDRDHGRFGRGFDPLFRGRNGISNIGRFDNDARIRAGVSSIRGSDFGHGGGHFERGMSSQQFHSSSFMTGRVPATPNRQSLGRVQEHVLPGIAHTANANNQHFFSQSRSSFTQRSFSQEASAQQRAVEGSRGQNGAVNNRFSAPAEQRNGGNQTFRGNAGAASQNRAGNNGWHSFSENGGARGQGQTGAPSRSFNQPDRSSNQPNRSFSPPTHTQQGTMSRGEQPSPRVNQQGSQRPNGNDAWHRFTPPSNSGARPQQQQMTQPRGNQSPSRSFQQAPASRPDGNWRQFTPPSNNGSRQQTQPRSNPGRPNNFSGYGSEHGNSGYGNSPRGDYGGSSRGSYGNYSRGSYGNYSSRPQLNMRQPVVNQRSYSGPSRSYGGYSGRPSGGSYSRPSGGGGSYRGGGGGGGGSRGGSAPRSSGGGNRGGGGRPHR